jgi:uncharacterized protein YbjT (DUF2867 family)
MSRVLLIGGTGLVGSLVAERLVQLGVPVRLLTRSRQRLAAIAPPIEGVRGDLNDSESLREAFRGVDALFLVTAHSITETGQGLTALHAALDAGVRRVVFLSAAVGPGTMRIPHVASKAPIEHTLITSRIEHTILRASNLFQNDRCVDEFIVGGLYPQPIGRLGIHRIDARDIADAAVTVLTRPGHSRHIYTLGSPEVLTGESVAASYERCLDRRVRYAGDDLELWERTVAAGMPKWKRDDYRIMYRFYQEHGLVIETRDLVGQEAVIGHEPRRFADYVSSVCDQLRERELAVT